MRWRTHHTHVKLAQALGQLLAELRAQQAEAELTSLVADAKDEAEAQKPNKLKLERIPLNRSHSLHV
jgi:hypothetical protein